MILTMIVVGISKTIRIQLMMVWAILFLKVFLAVAMEAIVLQAIYFLKILKETIQ